MWEYHGLLLDGLWITLQVLLLGIVLAVVAAFVVGIAGLSDHRWVRWPAMVWVEFWRGTSMLVQLFLLFYVLPFFGVELTPLACGVLALGLNEGAYAAEIVRSSIKARPKGQSEAAVALGMSKTLRMRRVLIPQSIPAMLPPFGNVAVDTLKNTSLVALVTLGDLTYQTQQVWKAEGHTFGVYGTLLVMYFVLAMIIAGIMKLLEMRFGVGASDRGRNGFFMTRSPGGGLL